MTPEQKKVWDTLRYIIKVDDTSNKYWFLNDLLHREDGPAVESANGDRFWFLHGKRHREDGPAIEKSDGSKAWYLNGQLHREDGPAVINALGYHIQIINSVITGNSIYLEDTSWFLNGIEYTEEEFNEKINEHPK